jgi:signal transduction histidine kinase
LQKVLRHLVTNAIKYTPEKGSIVISVQANQESGTVSVKDNGYGIPPKDLPLIFNRFYRAYSDEIKDIEGNGLGLSIVKSIVEQHGGQVNVESEYGKGSCFSIRLPLSQPHELAVSSLFKTNEYIEKAAFCTNQRKGLKND